ncbi:MAG: GGDEF domain-containing protein [Gemmatimonadota bacterium]
MKLINVDLPRGALILNVCIAALAAVGITSLIGGRGQAIFAVPVLTVILTLALLLQTREISAWARRVLAGPTVTRDPLTGVATEEVAEEVLAREFAAAQRGRPLAIVLIRLEGLPRYRVEHGQAVADQLLRVTGRTLAQHRRGMHVAARHGGREGTFISILSGSDRDGAAVYAARLRQELLRLKGLPELSGVSVGIAAFDMSMASPRELVRKAAFALERGAAAGGKVMVVGAGSDAA